MTEKIKAYFSTFLPLDNEDLETFAGKFTFKDFKKGDYFIKEGNLSSEIGFILKGCLVCVYNKDGVDVIDEFCTKTNLSLIIQAFWTANLPKKM